LRLSTNNVLPAHVEPVSLIISPLSMLANRLNVRNLPEPLYEYSEIVKSSISC